MLFGHSGLNIMHNHTDNDPRGNTNFTLTVDHPDTHAAAPRVHGRHVYPLVCFIIVGFDCRQTWTGDKRRNKVRQRRQGVCAVDGSVGT